MNAYFWIHLANITSFSIFQVKLTVRAEVMGGAILQQVFIVEYTIANQMCDDCHRTEAQDYWRALVIFLLALYLWFGFLKEQCNS